MALTCPKCGDALVYPVCYRCSPEGAYLARPVSQPGQRARTSGFEILGGLFFVLGILLLIGNVTGLFPTFPFAGFICMFIGGLVAKLG